MCIHCDALMRYNWWGESDQNEPENICVIYNMRCMFINRIYLVFTRRNVFDSTNDFYYRNFDFFSLLILSLPLTICLIVSRDSLIGGNKDSCIDETNQVFHRIVGH